MRAAGAAAPLLCLAFLCLAFLCLALPAPAAAQPAACQPATPAIVSAQGQRFAGEAYARLEWRERASGGKLASYARHIWRGRIGARAAYLTFDEIPGASGPNYAMSWTLERPGRAPPVRWRTQGTRYTLDARFFILSGPLKGEWRVEGC